MIFLLLPFWLKISILVNSFLPLSPSMSLTRIYSSFFSLFSTRVHICVPSLFTLHHPKVRILSIFEMNVLNRKLKYKHSLRDGNWFEVEFKNTKQILNIEFILLGHVSNEKFEILNIRGCKIISSRRVKYWISFSKEKEFEMRWFIWKHFPCILFSQNLKQKNSDHIHDVICVAQAGKKRLLRRISKQEELQNQILT